jgi:hypothetical protein
MNKQNILIVIISLSLVVLACSSLTKAKPAAESAITEFHNQFNAGEFTAIYNNSTDEFKKASTQAQLEELLSAISRKLGHVTSTTNTSWRTGNYNLVTTVVMVQETEFEQGKGTETFTYKIDGDKAALMGYNIVSNDLITK